MAFIRRAKRYTRLERLHGIERGVDDWEEEVLDKEQGGVDKVEKEEMDCKEEELVEENRGKVEHLLC